MKIFARPTTRTVPMLLRAVSACVATAVLGTIATASDEMRDGRVFAAGGACESAWIPTFGGMPGTNGTVSAMQAFDDGTGPALYLSGSFTTAGGFMANGIARWDGTSLQPVGDGSAGSGTGPMTVHDDGSGPALYTAGFRTPEGETLQVIAKWDGASWTTLPGEFSGGDAPVTYFRSLASYDDGSGPALYVGGNFWFVDGEPASYIARWDGQAWSNPAGGVDGRVNEMDVFDDGTDAGPVLIVGGKFETAGGMATPALAAWDGDAWAAVGGGLAGSSGQEVKAIVARNVGEPDGPALYVGGAFDTAGNTTVLNVARWDGVKWVPLGDQMSLPVESLAVRVDDAGSEPIAYAGRFWETGPGPFQWDGSEWSAVGGGMNGDAGDHILAVYTMEIFDDGSGPALFAGGIDIWSAGGVPTYHIGKWQDGAWHGLGTSLAGTFFPSVNATATSPSDGKSLYAGGTFTHANGEALHRIAKWSDDSAAWQPLGSGVGGDSSSTTLSANAIAVVDTVQGDEHVYVGGNFSMAGDVPVNRIASWDGASWRALGAGVGSPVGSSYVSAVYAMPADVGEVLTLVVGGRFTEAGQVTANGIAIWNGLIWQSLGSGVGGSSNAQVHAITSYKGDIIAGGSFTTAGGNDAQNIARWDGEQWHALGAGVTDGASGTTYVRAMAVYDGDLYVAGRFEKAGDTDAMNIARWNGETWHAVGSGMDAPVMALTTATNSSSGQIELYAGGFFATAGGVDANRIARWDGSEWSDVDGGVADGLVRTFAERQTRDGPELIVGGSFTSSPGGDSFIARWQACSDGSAIPGDLNGDGVVDGTDLALLLGAWGQCADCQNCPADLDGNCMVDGADLAVLLSNWG